MESGVLILTGPTASGKTELAIALARDFDAEIVSADSRQVYRGMTIGTAAPSADQRALAIHHLVEFLDPMQRYSAAQFAADALAAIAAIRARGRRAIVVGGTGFYLRALCGDMELSPLGDPQIRARLRREALVHPPETLFAWLSALDPVRAAALAPTDRYRVLRALEIRLVARNDGDVIASAPSPTLKSLGIPYRKLYLEIGRAQLAERIERRVDRMLELGLLDEAWRLGGAAIAADAVGYPQALAYLRGWSTERELRTALIRATRRYAKRQETWFRSEPDLLRIQAEQGYRAARVLARELPGWN